MRRGEEVGKEREEKMVQTEARGIRSGRMEEMPRKETVKNS